VRGEEDGVSLQVGDRVLCVDDRPTKGFWTMIPLILGGIYTISYVDPDDETRVCVVEATDKPLIVINGPRVDEYCYTSSHFAKLGDCDQSERVRDEATA
jgi:hypothetical protein